MANITLAVTGSISAYKAADLTSQLTKLGHQVTVLMSRSAMDFITPLTFQSLSKNLVHTDVMLEENPNSIKHIDIAKTTDLFIVAPASANTIAKLAHGLADNMVTATALALPLGTKKLVAPAMNTNMYLNPATQKNLKTLIEYGFEEIKPREALLACGDFGTGALAEIEIILEKVSSSLNEIKKTNQVATLAIFIAIMVVIETISQAIFAAFVLPIKPTITHIPVIIASIIYGPRIGAQLGGFMGIMSIIRNSIILSPLSYVFSPFVENGNIYSVLIALVPRILIGITPYYIYKLWRNKAGLALAGLTGTLTNTIFVLSGIFFFFGGVFKGDIKAVLAAIVSVNSIAEMVIATILTLAIVPVLQKVKK